VFLFGHKRFVWWLHIADLALQTRAVEPLVKFQAPAPTSRCFWLRVRTIISVQKTEKNCNICKIRLPHKISLWKGNPNFRVRIHSPASNCKENLNCCYKRTKYSTGIDKERRYRPSDDIAEVVEAELEIKDRNSSGTDEKHRYKRTVVIAEF